MKVSQETELTPQTIEPWLITDDEAYLSDTVDAIEGYFRRKASAVLNDTAALEILTAVYEDGVVEKTDLGLCEHCSSLSKLTAADFCEIGVDTVYITPHGNQFINNIRNA